MVAKLLGQQDAGKYMPQQEIKRDIYPVTDWENGIIAWEHQKDPLNPRNYPSFQKWLLLLLVSIITLISPLASSIFAPAAANAAQEFGVTSTVLKSLGVTAYLFGYGFGPLFLSPLSEIYGRRIILSLATSVFVLFQIGCALAPNFASIIVFRLLTGLGGSGCLTIGGGVVSDLFESEQRGLAMAIFSAGPLFGPVLGPICGGFIAQGAGWRWVFWILVIVGGTFTLFVMIFNRETNPIIIIQRKTDRLKKEFNRPDLRSFYDESSKQQSKTAHFIHRLTTPFQLLFRSPIVAIVALYIAVVYGCLYLLFTTVTDVFQNVYHWSEQISGLSYIGLGMGFIAGQVAFGLLSDRVLILLKDRNNDLFEPEMRLPLTIPFSFFVPISFFWYGWSVQAHCHWIVPIIGLFPFAFGLIGIFGTLQTYIIDCFPGYAASGIAAITVTRSFAGALLPLAGPPMYEALGYGWGNSLLGFVTLVLILMPVLFNRFGASLRKASPLQEDEAT
ncbi:major facilitator superfamily domain-containing protein [Trichoderma barbatum]